jgi:type I restriction enzyme, S subunit
MKGFGELPQGWISVPLEVVGRWGSGGTPKKGNNLFYGGNIPWLKIGDLTDGPVYSADESITEIGLKQSSAKLLPENTVLLAMYGSIGKLGITKIECATNQAIAFCFRDEKLIELKYLFFGLLFLRQEFIAQGQGGTQQNISQTILKQTKISLAPLAEQKRIVDKIETLFSDLDKGEALLKQVQQQLRVYRQSVLKAAVTGELTREWREQNEHRLESGEALLQRILELRRKHWKGRGKYLEPEIPRDPIISIIPDSWVIATIDQISSSVEYGSSAKCSVEENGVAVLRLGNI